MGGKPRTPNGMEKVGRYEVANQPFTGQLLLHQLLNHFSSRWLVLVLSSRLCGKVSMSARYHNLGEDFLEFYLETSKESKE